MALEQIGEKLRAYREGQGLSLAEISQRTRIPLNHLEAIDAGISDDLPEPVYVAGFIKRYGDCIGLNGQQLSDEYRREADQGQKNGDSGWAARAAYAPPAMVSPAYMKRARINNRPPNMLATIVWPTVWMVLILGLLTFLWKFNNGNSANQEDVSLTSLAHTKLNTGQTTSGQLPNGPVKAGPTQTGTAQQQQEPQDTESKISLTASQHVWVEVKAVSSGDSIFTGFLETGDRRDFEDPQGLRVHAGNGASVTVETDGKSQTLGLPGKPTEKLFMSKNATASATGPDGTALAGGATAAPVKPVVKKIAKRPASQDAAAAQKRRFRSLDEAPSRGYLPGEMRGARSIDVPYRYTE